VENKHLLSVKWGHSSLADKDLTL